MQLSARGALAESAVHPGAHSVLSWWIGDPPYDADWLLARQALWFGADPAADRHIRTHFAGLVEDAANGTLDAWSAAPADWLALLVLLDQFPRNLWRDDARAFASDDKARALAEAGIADGFDQRLPAVVRLFCYLPLEHAEDADAQRRSVALFEQLQAQAPGHLADVLAGWTDYARRHAEPIQRFGRFPHRNAALGRATTAAERAWLQHTPQGF